MSHTIHPSLLGTEPAAQVIQSLRSSLKRWRAVAVMALLSLAGVCAYHWPQVTSFVLLILAHAVVAWGGYVYLAYEGDLEMGIAPRQDGLR